MNGNQHSQLVSFVWGIADDCLRDVYVRGKYRDVILPLTVIRRLDAVLEPTKEAVLKLSKQLDKAGVANKHAALCQASENAFYNISQFTLRDLRARAKQQQLKADFEAYLDGFSRNVQEILEKFKFRNQIPTLIEADILGSLIEKFTSNNIKYGSTLSSDAFPSMEFDFMLSNPPYGKSWKTDLERMGGKKDLADPRFTIQHDGDELSFVTRSSDGQLMFLVNKLAKVNHKTPLGSRIAEVHNGSSLFTGDAGQGESNIRRWIIENDWCEAIIALPLNMFYNTGIATYIWVLTNRKPEHRKGKVQLIDATGIYQPLRKNLGKKNCEFSDEQIRQVTDVFLAFEETEQSKIFPNAAFGYWKIVVERPLRLAAHVTPEKLAAFEKTADKKLHKPAELLMGIAGGPSLHMDFNVVRHRFESALKKMDLKLRATDLKAVYAAFTFKDESAEPVIKKKTKKGIEYEPDTDLRDTEQVPLLEEGGVEAFFHREVLPHVPDAWIDHSKTQIGYEISFTRHFYKPQPLRSLDEIRGDLESLQAEAEGLLDGIINRAVTRGLDSNAPLKPSGIHWIDDIPKHWTHIRLKYVADVQTGITLGKNYTGQHLEERPYLRVANVQTGHVDLRVVKTVNVPTSEVASSELRAGDVLMTEGGDIDKLGRGCVWQGEIEGCLHQNHIFAVRVKQPHLLPEYLVALMASRHGRMYFELTAKRTTNLASTNSTTLRAFPLVLPPVEEQQQILESIADNTRELDAVLDHTHREIDLIREYRTRLIADVVTGKVDVRNLAPAPGDEITEIEDMDVDLDDEEMDLDDEPELIKEAADADD